MSDDFEYVTQATKDRLEARLEQLRAKRPEIEQRIADARDHGDISENAELDAAKEEQEQNERMIIELEDRLARIRVGAPPTSAEGTVSVGTVVTTQEEGGTTREFFLGSIEDQPENLDFVSATSPLGRALVGAKIGDEVTYTAPAGTFTVTVKDVRPL